MSCASPIAAERLVAYLANDCDAGEVAAIEEHIFACDECARESERIAHYAQTLRTRIPPIVRREDVDAMRAEGLAVRENMFAPGVRKDAVFQPGDDVLIHRLGGLDLAGADRVDVLVRSEHGGPIFKDLFVPFDEARGEVLIACQRHFQLLGPPEVAFDVEVHRKGAPPVKATYFIPHVFS